MTTLLERVSCRFAGTPPLPANMPDITTTPAAQTGQVIFCGFSSGGFNGQGKVDARSFFPAFCKTLHQAGMATHFAHTPNEMLRHLKPETCLVHIYREIAPENISLYEQAMRQVAKADGAHRGAVFNDPTLGAMIARKDLTNSHLSKAGIAVPRMVTSDDTDAPVFANDIASTGAEVAIGYDPDRYNTEFIDTRVPYKGKDYYTTVRLLCVGGALIHCNVGARDASESASVHGRDAPMDPEMLEYLQGVLVHSRIDALKDLAKKLGDVLGLGFFGHDLVICNKTGIPHVCEVGFKFDANAYRTHLAPLADQLPSHSTLFDGGYEARAGQAFLAEHKHHRAKATA